MATREEQLIKGLRDAAVALKRTTSERDELAQRYAEPIAIIGMGCRFPGGANTPAAFFQLLAQGRDAIAPLESRWNLVGEAPPAGVPAWAGLLPEVAGFDAAFFGISPREARTLDPQHRLLLEVTWEALEHGGLVPAALSGSRTGVFIGACAADYSHCLDAQPDAIKDAYGVTGNMLSILTGRISYTFGFRGPCLMVDTACSSSLVAVHLACHSLRSKESALALAGGVNLILSPRTMTALARTQAMSPDGRCKTFDAGANGFVRGEGCGVVVLKRLTDARRDGDRIWALIAGSAVNQDGRSAGLTAPSVPAQESLLREALAAAGVTAESIGFVETHGTGTSLGDPIEVEALRAVLGAPRQSAARCVLGAVKTNIGHLEGAAGIAGLIKGVLALHQEQIPPNLNFRTLNPRIRLEGTSLSLANQATPWPRSAVPRCAGISSFGLSGTNAHVVLQEAPAAEQRAALPERPAELCVVSARTAESLDRAVDRLAAQLDAGSVPTLGALCHGLATTRASLEHRLAVAVGSREELRTALTRAAGTPVPATVARGQVGTLGKLAWLFTGQGAQTLGMGRALYEAWPAFRQAFEAACAALDPHLARPLREVMWAEPGTQEAELLDQTEYTQPALFALEWALAALWSAWGVTPDFVGGHSIGELTAACVAGVFSLADGARLVAARGRLMQALPAGGAMVAIGAGEAEVAAALLPYRECLSIAAVNAPDSVVIAGDQGPLLAVTAELAGRGYRTRQLRVSHAFHSPRMEPMQRAFQAVAESVQYHAPAIPLLSNVSGGLGGAEVATAAYWVRHARAAVRFVDGVQALAVAGVKTFMEVGPKSTLMGLVAACLPGTDVGLMASLRADRSEPESVLAALGEYYVRGGRVAWAGVFPGGRRVVDLPTYPFQRQHFWLEGRAQRTADVERLGLERSAHPLLGSFTSLPDGSYLLTSRLSLADEPWLRGHAIFGQVLLPGSAYVELALYAGTKVGLGELASLTIHTPLVLSHGAVRLQLTVAAAQDSGQRTFLIHSRAVDADPEAGWRQHAAGVLRSAPAAAAPALAGLVWPPPGAASVAPDWLYAQLQARGYAYGPDFRGLQEVYVCGQGRDQVLAGQVELPPALSAEHYLLHPALLDAALHTLAAYADFDTEGALPFAWEGVQVHIPGATRLRVQAQLNKDALTGLEAALKLYGSAGELVAEVARLRFLPATSEMLKSVEAAEPDHLYRLQWLEQPLAGLPAASGRWAFLCPEGLLPSWARKLAAAGMQLSCHPSVDVLRSALARDGKPDQIVYVIPAEAPGAAAEVDPAMGAQRAVEALLGDLQSFLQDDQLAGSRFVVLSQEAVTTAEQEPVPAFWQAALWGLLRSARGEHPDRRWLLVDTDGSAASTSCLFDSLRAEDEQEVALRQGRRLVPRIVRAGVPSAPRPAAPVFAPEGTVLVTGGTRGLGAEVARHLAEKHQVKHLLLVSRQGAGSEGLAALQATLAAVGCQITVAACDVADSQALTEVLAQLPPEHPLTAVFHIAAALDDGVLSALNSERIARVFAGKARGAWNLHQATRDRTLSAFVVFSSAAGTLGSAGQGGYAAANAFVDALCAYRQAQGLPGQALAFGSFADVGAAALLPAPLRQRLRQHGMVAFAVREGLAQCDRALLRSEALLLPMHLDLQALRQHAAAVEMPSVLRLLVGPLAKRAAIVPADGGMMQRLRGLPVVEQSAELQRLVSQEVAAVLRLPDPATLRPEQPIKDLGLDSLMALELRNRLQLRTGLRLEVTAIWRLANLSGLTAELMRELVRTPASAPVGGTVSGPAKTLQRPQMFPLSPGQHRLWILHQLLARPEVYNTSIGLRLRRALDESALRQALEILVARHEQLRVCFSERDGLPQQRVLPWVEPVLAVADLTHAAPAERESQLAALIDEHGRQPFNLAQPPLFRLQLVRLGADECALALAWHHIVTDAISIAIFFHELSDIYLALVAQKEPEALLGPSYVEHGARVRTWLQSEAAAAQRNFWREQLRDLPELHLPTDRPLPKERDHRGGLLTFGVSAATSRAVEELARAVECTPFVVLVAAWSVLLSRYSGQEDLAIGTFVSGRNEPGLERAIGFFVNTLPLRCDLRNNPPFAEYLLRVRDRVWAMLENQELPFDEIVGQSAVRKQAGFSSSPLFRVAFILEEASWFQHTFAGSAIEFLTRSVSGDVEGTAKFDLNFSMIRGDSGYHASLEYAADLFDHETMQRLCSHFVRLLDGIAENPQGRVQELPLLPEAEWQQVVVAWNDTRADWPQTCIHHLVEAQAQRSPAATALVYEGQRLSYQALDARANQLAHHLRNLGVGPEVLVAIYVQRGIEMIVGLLGILKAGGAYVPLDPEAPAERLAFILKDAAAPLVLTQASMAPKLGGFSGRVLCVDQDPAIFQQPSEAVGDTGVRPHNLAYVCYTSGSSGRPKGVMTEHRSVCNMAAVQLRCYDVGTDSRVLQFAPLFFDGSAEEIFVTLTCGAELHLLPREVLWPGPDLVRILRERRITVLILTPSALAALPLDPLPDVKVLEVAGEVCPAELVAQWAPGRQMWNAYGPTETTVNATIALCGGSQKPPPIGRPLANTQVYVLDAHRNPVPIGVAGELYIGGVGVARGYLGDGELTARKFVASPFLTAGPETLYRTGDRGRFLKDGSLEFLGRLDQQIKLRGHRIELGEIEAVLSAHADVERGVVVLREEPAGDKRLVAYVVLRAGAVGPVEALRQHLRAALPEYMLPAALIVLDALPLTATGKLDRKALPTPSQERGEAAVVGPRTPTEQTLAELFAALLRLDRVSTQDDFFALGGHSLLAVQLVARAQAALARPVPLSLLFRHPTVERLAAALQRPGPAADARSSLICLQEGSPAHTPLFFVHGSGGSVRPFSELSRHLDPAQPFYGIQAPELDAGQPAPSDVVDRARQYVQQLQRVQQRGPYQLGGWSSGGVVAFEMARLLHAAGHDVALLALVESHAPSAPPPTIAEPLLRLGGFAATLGIDWRRIALDGAQLQRLDRRGQLLHLLQLAAPLGGDDPPDLAQAERLYGIFERHFEALARYRPVPQSQSAVLFVAESQPVQLGGAPDLGWGSLVRGRLTIHPIPGDHFTVLRPPHVAILADRLRAHLLPNRLPNRETS